MEWYGYAGKILRVNLTQEKISSEPLDRKLVREYLGGTGYAAKLMWDELKPGIDPLSPDNLLIFATGPVTGTLFPVSGSHDIVFKSPLTGIWGESRCGGFFGPRLKFAGYDFIVISGKAKKPVYLWICDGEAELRDASHLWGKGTHETARILLEELGLRDVSVNCIGPAGERLVRFAAILDENDRAAGRCGGGAVMGSKNLKAVAVSGSGEIKVARPREFEEALSKVNEAAYKFKKATVFAEYGTPGIVEPLNETGAFPTMNFQTCYFENAHEIGGEALVKKYLIKRRSCFACLIGCGRHTEVKSGTYQTPAHEGPEYETINMFGGQLLIDNLAAIIKANYLCNDYGLDTISTGNCIAFAIEAYEKGLISEELVGGLILEWGNPTTLLELIEAIAFKRSGLGELLAEGVWRASKKLGDGAEAIAVHVKGLEAPAHDPRGTSRSFAIQYAIGNRGGCHTHPNWTGLWDFGKFDPGLRSFDLPWPPIDRFDEENVEKRAKAVKLFALHGLCAEILGFCRFFVENNEGACASPKILAEFISALLGFDINEYELMRISERVFNLQRCFNIREGIGRKDDALPKRFFEPIKSGPTKGQYVKNFERLLEAFYREAGWDAATGIPTKSKLLELGLDYVINQIPAP
ncbi:MAG: aldehyde ferredoxin oxidoreductase family protein [Candidatus Bathyarchaeia archaeon]